MVFPVFWMLSTAFKPDDEINGDTPTWFSLSPTLQHFRDAMNRPYFWDTVQNSLVVVCVTVVASIVLAFLAAVALAKYRFTGRKVFLVLMIGILMLPAAGLVIPLYVVLARYHLTNTLTGVILTYMTFVLPFAVWTLRGFVLGIPKDLEEAAMVDGSSRIGAFVRILLPLVAPGLVATPMSERRRALTVVSIARGCFRSSEREKENGVRLIKNSSKLKASMNTVASHGPM